MNVSKKLTGMIAAATAICTLGSGSALAAESVKTLEVKPAVITQIGSFLIRVRDQLGKIAVYQDAQNENSQAYQVTVTTDGDVSSEAAIAVDVEAADSVPYQKTDIRSDHIVITKYEEETGTTLISTDGGQTWEPLDVSFQTQNK